MHKLENKVNSTKVPHFYKADQKVFDRKSLLRSFINWSCMKQIAVYCKVQAKVMTLHMYKKAYNLGKIFC